jgi:hypothetical protein
MVDPATDRETSDYRTWLQRANLTPEDVFKLKTAEIARIGRQWIAYQVQLKRLLAETDATEPEQIRIPWLENRAPRL